jgi:hypothetical protein
VLPAERERATTLVIHVDRADMRLVTDGAVHIGATQLGALIAPISTPTLAPAVAAATPPTSAMSASDGRSPSPTPGAAS